MRDCRPKSSQLRRARVPFNFSETILRKRPFAKVLLALASALLLICSLPSPDVGWLGWVALVPLMLACHDLPPMRAARLGLLFGVVSSFGIYGWLFEVPSFDLRHAVVLSLYVGLYPTAWSAAVAWTTRRQVPLFVAAPILWVAIDYVRAHAGFLALPWGTLAQTQHANLPVIQVASLGGEHAVTFLVAFGNASLANMMLRREPRVGMIAGILVALAHLWGAGMLHPASQEAALTITAIQPNIQIAERETEEGRRANLERLEQLTRRAAADRPALIVWPESAIPGDLHRDLPLVTRVQHLSDQIGIPLILGAAQVEKFAKAESEITIDHRMFNTAHLFQSGNPLAHHLYRKRVLVPFAEYLPRADLIPWPEWLAPRVAEMTPGNDAQLFNVADDLSVGALICWENLFASLARESVQNGARLLVQLTNDAWFGNSAAPHQHNLMSVMRAVENRVPVVIASNTGPSQIIDAYGRIVAGAPGLFSEGIVTGVIQTGAAGTLYNAVGDRVLFSMLAGAGAWVMWPIITGLFRRSSIVRAEVGKI